MSTELFRRLATSVLDHRGRWAAVLMLVVLAATAGAKDLEINFSVRAFFGGDDPEIKYLKTFQEAWGPDDDTVIIVVKSSGGSLFTPDNLERIQTLVEAAEGAESVERVSALTNAARMYGDSDDEIDVEPIHEAIAGVRTATEAGFVRLKNKIMGSHLFVPAFISADETATAILVELDESSDDVLAVQPRVEALRATLAEVEGLDDLEVAAAGIPVIRADFFNRLSADQMRYLPLTGFIIVVLMVTLFRRFHGMVGPCAAAMVPTMMVFGLMGYLGEPIGILNQALTTLLPVIAVADAIHLVSRFHEEVRRRLPPHATMTPEVRREAIIAATSKIGGACFLTSLTTAVGFLSLRVAEMPILRNFGTFAALGIIFAYATVLFIIPILLTFASGSVPDAGREEEPTPVDRGLLWCARLSLDRPWTILAATFTFILICLWFSTKTVADNKLTALLRPEHPTSRANELTSEKLGGLLGLEIDLVGSPEQLMEPEVLAPLLEFERWARTVEGVRTVIGPAGFVAELNAIVTGDEEIPQSRAGVAQLLLLTEGVDRMGELFNDDRGRGRMVIRSVDEGGLAFDVMYQQITEKIRTDLSDVPIRIHATGVPSVAYRGINNVTRDLRNSLGLAFVTIAIIIGFLFRNLRIALICLVPNALPLLVGYGLMGFMAWMLEPTPAVIFVVALGIAVDDTIHMMVRYREERAKGLTHRTAVERSVLHSGRAVGITSVILSAGFAVNTLSSFLTFTVFGALGAVVILVAFVCDLFVLPALLALFGEGARRPA